MKKNLLAALTLAVVVFASSCKKDNDSSNSNFSKRSTTADYSGFPATVQAVSGDITTNTTWTSDKVWEISGVVTVTSGATLTIQPGTFIKSSANVTGVQNGVLVIARGARIDATGTAAAPIVFTSRNLLDGDASTVGKPGDFGGVIVLGNAHVNTGTKSIEGLNPGNSNFTYGGSAEADNSGTIKYVRIEYAGFQLAENNEVNGLTLGGVGSGTTLDYIQVSYGLDDSFEFFGGSVNATHLLSLAADDDNFDFDNGYNGSIQYAIAVADGNSTHSVSGTSSDSNGIESDNNAPTEDATFSLLPKTHPTLTNISIIGTNTTAVASGLGYKYGVRNRRGAEITLRNSIITGYPSGFVFDGTTPSLSTLANNSVHGFTIAIDPATAAAGNVVATGSPASAFNIAQPWFNAPGSPTTLDFLVSTGVKGAVTSTTGNWTATWTKFVF